MSSITSREQFLQLLGDAERLALALGQASAGSKQQLCQVIAQHLAFARATVADGTWPSAEQKAAVQLAVAAQQLAPGPAGENADAWSAWLHSALPMLDGYYRALEPPPPPPVSAPVPPVPAPVPPERYELGRHVTVRWPTGVRYLGFVRLPHEQSYLVAFATGHQQWLDGGQLEAAPSAGDRVMAATPSGEARAATLVAFEQGRYLVDFGEGRREWVEWTAVQPL
jgi:hypothetical protein